MDESYRFGAFEFHPGRRQLVRDGRPLSLGGRALDLLQVLIAERHRVVGREELLDRCWPGEAVEENNLAVQIWALRRALGPECIATVARRGYRFVAPLVPPAAAAFAAEPPASATLIGRDVDCAALLALLRQHRLTTVLGPAGVGKSRLAEAAAAQMHPWRTVRVDLSPLAHADAVENALRQALGIVDVAKPGAGAAGWLGALPPQPTLLFLLDNCEHVAGAVAALAVQLIGQAPAARILATSLVPLGVAGEQRLRLRPLAIAEGTAPDAIRASPAVQLLLARVAQLDPAFAVPAADLPLAADLCRRLDGLPLAIELAAVRLPGFGLRGVHERLDDQRFELLTRAAAPQRHVTLAQALGWSVSLLAAEPRRLFAALGVFRGSFGIDLATALGPALGQDAGAVLDGLTVLVDHSLLVSEAAPAGHDATPRLRLLESAREFALGQLRDGGNLEALRAAHAQAVCASLALRRAQRETGRLSGDATLGHIRDELFNVRTAMDWVLASAPERAACGHSIAADTWPAMLFMGLHHEATRWLEALEPLLRDDETPPRVAGFLLMGLGKLGLRVAADPARRHRVLERARALLDCHSPAEYQMAVRQCLAQSACQRGDAAAALAITDDALARHGPRDFSNYKADLTIWRGIALALLGRRDEAHAAYADALPLCVPDGNEQFLFLALCDLAELEVQLGLHVQAAQRLQMLIAGAGARGLHSQVVAPLWAALEACRVVTGDLAGARAAAGETWRQMSLNGCPLEGSHMHAHLLAAEGDAERAMLLAGAGDRQWRVVGETRLLGEPASRAAAIALAERLAGPAQCAAWRDAGARLTPDAVAAKLFGA